MPDKRKKKVTIAGKEYYAKRGDAPKGLTRTRKQAMGSSPTGKKKDAYIGSRGKYKTKKRFAVEDTPAPISRPKGETNAMSARQREIELAKGASKPTKRQKKIVEKSDEFAGKRADITGEYKSKRKALKKITKDSNLGKAGKKAVKERLEGGQKVFTSIKSEGLKRDIRHNRRVLKRR